MLRLSNIIRPNIIRPNIIRRVSSTSVSSTRNISTTSKLFNDGIEINGGQILGCTVDSYGDHRIAMSFAIAGLVSKNPITILDTENVSTSFPGFLTLIKDMGLKIERSNS